MHTRPRKTAPAYRTRPPRPSIMPPLVSPKPGPPQAPTAPEGGGRAAAYRPQEEDHRRGTPPEGDGTRTCETPRNLRRNDN